MTERREYQRLYLTEPLAGWFGDFEVRLLDVSANGALVEHREDVPDDSCALLRFFWRGEEIELLARTVRNADGSSGLAFEEQSAPLRAAIARCAEEVVRAREANARGDRAANVIDGDQTLTAAAAGARGGLKTYVTMSLTPQGWIRTHSLLPAQPENGFTVSALEPHDHVDLLCWTWENGDDEARRMTRMLAELSVAGAAE